MAIPFNPLDHYWAIGGGGPHLDDQGNYTGDASRVFSSKRNGYVPNDDAEFQAWRTARRKAAGVGADDPTYYPITLIDTEENLAAVLEPYGIDPDFAGPPP